MSEIKVLDCTLRDGGYCNQWKFGFENIKSIINGLCESCVDIIECGFLSNKVQYDKDVTKFKSINEIIPFLPKDRKGRLFVAMANYGELDIDSLPNYDGTSIDGIRIAFHKKDRYEALKLCEKVKEKGYKSFIQPMVSVSYSDFEFIEMINLVNTFKPYAFYIVDSFGMMKNKDLMRLFYMVEHNLDNSICIGFHSHNNIQLAYSNALSLVNNQTNRHLIIDSSVFGMGRGAGNLNTELFVEFLNDNFGEKYNIKPLLRIIDETLNKFYHNNYWGYSLPNYLSAKHNAHPNYAGYLSDKNTLTFEDIDEIFTMMTPDKKVVYDKEYIEQLYLRYMEKGNVQSSREANLKAIFENKEVLLIAPGKSSQDEKDHIIEYISTNKPVTISVNFDYPFTKTDFVFVSNLRRFKELDKKDSLKCIATSNIPYQNLYYQADYKLLVNQREYVSDNAGLMVIKLLINFGARKITLAGFDGYSHEIEDNYWDDKMAVVTRNAFLDNLNLGMREALIDFKKYVDISFLTKEKHIVIGE